jgi:hypothetical protein
MRPRPSVRITAAGAVFALALFALPAQAQEAPNYDVPHPAWKDGPPQPYPQHATMDPEARDGWLAECRHRLSMHDRRRDRDDREREPDQCEAYLDGYYAYYRRYQGPGQAYAYPSYVYASPCCQPMPMMMAPVMRMPRAEPKCTETVEYEYEDVPVRPRPRPAPDKRIKVVPDKRIPIK